MRGTRRSRTKGLVCRDVRKYTGGIKQKENPGAVALSGSWLLVLGVTGIKAMNFSTLNCVEAETSCS